jgi:hypothetical protein
MKILNLFIVILIYFTLTVQRIESVDVNSILSPVKDGFNKIQDTWNDFTSKLHHVDQNVFVLFS